MVPRLCLSPFLRAGQTLSPPGSSRSLLLLPGLSLRSRDSSPPDKPVAPAGARREGPSLEQRRWEKEGEQQAGRAALIHALLGSPSLLLQGPAGALDWETRQEQNWAAPAANTELFLRSQPGTKPKSFPKPITTSVLDRLKASQGELCSA